MNLCFQNENLGKLGLDLIRNNDNDFKLVEEILTDGELMKTSTIFNREIAPNIKHINDVFNIFISCQNLDKDDIGMFKIYDSADNFIGVAGFVLPLENENDILEFGFLIKKEFQSKHIGSDVCFYLFDYIKNNYPSIRNIIITAFDDNIKSNKILSKIGCSVKECFYKNKDMIAIYSINEYKLNLLKNNLLTTKV